MTDREFKLKKCMRSVRSLFSVKRTYVFVFIVFTMIVSSFFYLSHAPGDFPTGRTVRIEQGSSLTDISHVLTERSVITSPLFFKASVRFLAKDTEVFAGDYFFDEPLSVFEVIERITQGNFGLVPVKVTILEGSTIFDIAELFEEKFPEFESSHFLELANGSEGYLFPDTYFFLPNIEEKQVFEELREAFNDRITSIEEDIEVFDRPIEDIVIMASIIEKEAWKEADRRLISSVLWNRIDIGMPLQVDAVFLYINGKNTYELTYDDLDTDSPYNTYRYKGLPEGPICNPSLSSLKAAVLPDESQYLFYMSDRVGNTYYAVNFDEHKQNRRLYLD